MSDATSPAASETPEQIKRRALSLLRQGDFALAGRLLERGDASVDELAENLRIYQVELEAQAAELKESQVRLQAALGRAEKLFQALPLPVVLTDVFGLVRSANEAAERELGMRARRVGDASVYRWLESGDDRSRLQAAYLRCAQDGHTVVRELSVSRPAGTALTFDFYLEHLPAAYAADAHDQFILTAVDQTDRLQMLGELRRTYDALVDQQRENGRLAEVARLTGQAVVITDAQRRIEWVNAAFTRITGYEAHEVLGRTPGRLLQGPDSDPVTLAQMAHALGQGRAVEHVEILNYAKDHRPYWLLLDIRPVRDAHGAVVQFVAVQTDITERKRAEQVLRDSEARQRAILEAEPNGVLLIQRDGRLRQVNPAGLRMLGAAAPEDLVGRQTVDFVAAADRAAFRAQHARGMTGESGDLRITVDDGAGHTLPVQMTCAPLMSNGQVESLLAILRDVSGEVEAERLRVEKNVAEQASRAKTEFLSRMSHELRTPLNAVLGFAQLLDSTLEQTSGPVQHERLRHIQNAGWQLLSMIDDVLDLSRVESNQVAIDCRPLDLVETVQAAVRLLQPLADRAGISVSVVCDEPKCPTWADALRLNQVFNNLVSNAIKYNRAAGWVEVRVASMDGMACVEVVDSGPGLTDEQRAHLFEPFNRLGAERTAVSGTGIGLVISRRLVELMGGRIEVGTGREGGALFRVLLPREAPDSDAPDPDAAPRPRAAEHDTVSASVWQAQSAPPRRVLYVEDDEVNVAVMQAIFGAHPAWQLAVATDGASGWARARADLPDLCLLDMHLPDTTGLALRDRLAQDAATSSIACVLVTADATEDTRRLALEHGFAGVLHKPFDLGTFLQVIEGLMAPTHGP